MFHIFRSVSYLSDLLDLGSKSIKGRITSRHNQTEGRIGQETQTREEFFPSGVTSSVMGLFLTGILLNTQQNLPRISLGILDRKGVLDSYGLPRSRENNSFYTKEE
jgi:hypothetical protein